MKKILLLFILFSTKTLVQAQITSTEHFGFYSENTSIVPLGSGYCMVSLDDNSSYKRLNITYFDKEMNVKWKKSKTTKSFNTFLNPQISRCGEQAIAISFGFFQCDISINKFLIVNENGDIFGSNLDKFSSSEKLIGTSNFGYAYIKSDQIYKIKAKDSTVVAEFGFENIPLAIGISDTSQLFMDSKKNTFIINDNGDSNPVALNPLITNTYTKWLDLSKSFFLDTYTLNVYEKKSLKKVVQLANSNYQAQNIYIKGDSLYHTSTNSSNKSENLDVYRIDSLGKFTKVLSKNLDFSQNGIFIQGILKREKDWISVGFALNAKSKDSKINNLISGENDALISLSDSFKLAPLKQNIALKVSVFPQIPTYDPNPDGKCGRRYLFKNIDFQITNLGKDTIKNCILKQNDNNLNQFDISCGIRGGSQTELKNIIIPPSQTYTHNSTNYCVKPDFWSATQRTVCFRVTAPNKQLDNDIFDNSDCIIFDKANDEVTIKETTDNTAVKMYLQGENLKIQAETSLNDAKITIFDLAGRLVFQQKIEENNNEIVLPDLEKSMYIAVLFQNEIPLKYLKIVR